MLILPMLFGVFRPPKPDNRICCDTHWMVKGYIFSCAVIILHPQAPISEQERSISIAPGRRREVCVFGLGIDRANEVELLVTRM